MKFIIKLEEDGYELRCWDDIEEEIGELLIQSWNMHDIYEYLIDSDFEIKYKKLKGAESRFENESFIILSENEGESEFEKELVVE